MKHKYKVEYLENNEWVLKSSHQNFFYADIQKGHLLKKQKQARIMFRGKEVFQEVPKDDLTQEGS